MIKLCFITDTFEEFNSKPSKVLRSVIKYLNIPEEEYYITSIIPCKLPENREPTKEEIYEHLPTLQAKLTELEPKMLVTLGKMVSNIFFTTGSIKDNRGKVFLSDWGCYEGIVTYHPAVTLFAKGDTLFPYILGDIQKAYNIANGYALYKPEDMETKVVIISTDNEMSNLITRLLNLPPRTEIVFDWETTGLNPMYSTGFCLGLSWSEGHAVVIPMPVLRPWSIDLNCALSHHKLIGYNAVSFDTKWNRLYGLPDIVSFDPMLWHYLMDERPQQRSLEKLSSFFLNAPCYESEMMATYKAKKATMTTDIPAEIIYEYCGKDVDWTLRLYNFFKADIDKEPQLFQLYQSLLHPAANAFVDIEQAGLWVDQEALTSVDDDMVSAIANYLDEFRYLTGRDDFNPNSHKQVQEMLWDTLELKEPKLYKRKDRAADKLTVDMLLEAYPDEKFLQTLKDYRETFTMYSRYIKRLPDYIDPDGRVRASYHFDRTETGRLSTTNPAIHQIPRNGKIRSIFAAPPGSVLVQADYAQIEVRMAAHIANDDKLIAMLESGIDFHSYMAAKAAGVPIMDVTKEQIQAAKILSFGLLYMMSDKGLIVQTGLDRDDAIKFIQSYKALMPGVQQWIEDTKAAIRNEQFIQSPYGRRRRFPLITADNLDGLYREGVNFPIQSGASDITLSSVVKLHDLFKWQYPEAKIVIMVHDSIIVECPEFIAEEVAQRMKEVMEEIPFITLGSEVPFPVDINISRRWGEK